MGLSVCLSGSDEAGHGPGSCSGASLGNRIKAPAQCQDAKPRIGLDTFAIESQTRWPEVQVLSFMRQSKASII